MSIYNRQGITNVCTSLTSFLIVTFILIQMLQAFVAASQKQARNPRRAQTNVTVAVCSLNFRIIPAIKAAFASLCSLGAISALITVLLYKRGLQCEATNKDNSPFRLQHWIVCRLRHDNRQELMRWLANMAGRLARWQSSWIRSSRACLRQICPI